MDGKHILCLWPWFVLYGLYGRLWLLCSFWSIDFDLYVKRSNWVIFGKKLDLEKVWPTILVGRRFLLSSHLFSWGRHLVLLRSHPLFNLTTIVLAAFWSRPMRTTLKMSHIWWYHYVYIWITPLVQRKKVTHFGNCWLYFDLSSLVTGRYMCNYKQLIGSPSFHEILRLVHSGWHTYNTYSHER